VKAISVEWVSIETIRRGRVAHFTESALETVNEYKAFRKKLDSRRLALDSAISRVQSTKKDSRSLELEVENCRERL